MITKPQYMPTLKDHLEYQKTLETRIQELEDVLNTIYHSTSSTTYQMELIQEVLPQNT